MVSPGAGAGAGAAQPRPPRSRAVAVRPVPWGRLSGLDLSSLGRGEECQGRQGPGRGSCPL